MQIAAVIDEQLVALVTVDVGDTQVGGGVLRQVAAGTLQALFIEDDDAVHPFGIHEIQANRPPPISPEIRESKPTVDLVPAVFRGTPVPGPANRTVAAVERLEHERLLVSGGRVFGDDDLRPFIPVNVGDGELGDGPEAVDEVESERPEHPAVTERDRHQFMVRTPGSGPTWNDHHGVEGTVAVQVGDALCRGISRVILVLLLAQRDIPENSSIASPDACQPGLGSASTRSRRASDGTNGLLCRTRMSGAPCGSTTRALTQ